MFKTVNLPKLRDSTSGVEMARILPAPGGRWTEIWIGRNEKAFYTTLCVVGYDEFSDPVTTSALLLPKDESVFVEAWGEIDRVKVTKPQYSDREAARVALHTLDALYGLPACPNSSKFCDCERDLDAKWRWAEACEAYVAAAVTYRSHSESSNT